MFKGVNKVMRAYIYWDFVINSAWGLLGPIFAIFILQTITPGNIAKSAEVIGFMTFAYWITKSILQIPIANYLDKNHGEIDDFWFYVIGTIITGLVPFGYLISTLPWHIYALQVLHAIGMSMVIPSSYAIFIRHADKSKEAYESALDSTLLGVGMGITGAVGGLMVAYTGFKIIFVIVGLFTFVSVLFIFWVKKDMFLKTHHEVMEVPPQGPFS